MATCPKCGKRLRLYQWRPECPYCGVNMIYYNANDRLLAETEKAEIEHAKSQPRIDRAKAAFFGSPPAIVRVVLSALPLGALFLPLGLLTSQENVLRVNALAVYDHFFVREDAGALLGGALKGDPLGLCFLLFLLSAVMILVCLICLVMSLGKHGKLRNLILNLIMLGSAAGAAAVFAAKGGTFSPDYTIAKLGWGAFIYLGLLAAILIYNLVLAKRGLPLKKTVCYIGGLPSDEYFAMKEQGVSELEIRKKMVEALTAMQDEVRRKEEEAKAEKARADAEQKRAAGR